MNIALWIAQALGAALFLMAGFTKTFTPMDKLGEKIPGMEKSPEPLVRFIGISELLGGIGLILPWATGIMPILTAIAAAGLATIMLLAIFVHLKKNEYKAIAMNVAFLGLMAFVAVGRFNTFA
ncbi:MAG: DoxX family protein [Sphingobacteriales bacterium JAD_PAG50586_3]|nr:MAG: DoxX family protein [Sphingobacteriales bacterium JAD_PAG50586_3]